MLKFWVNTCAVCLHSVYLHYQLITTKTKIKMTSITYTITANEIKINQLMNGQHIGTVTATYLFTENGNHYAMKISPRGKAAPVIVTDTNYSFEKYAVLDGTESIEEAVFAITSQSEIQDITIATRLATAMIQFLNK